MKGNNGREKMATTNTPVMPDAGERNRATGQAESAVTQSQPVPQASSRSQPDGVVPYA